MTPDFRLSADADDITAAIRDRLLELRVTDNAGEKSDALEVRLDDRDGRLVLPRTGARLDLALGYRESALTPMGLYVADEIALEGPPETMSIRARAADLRQGLKSPKTRPWDNISLGDLVETIASEHGYQAVVSSDLTSIQLTHLDQTEESDLHLLTRLAEKYGAVAKPVAGRLLLVPCGQAKSASGKNLPTVELDRRAITSWRVTLAERDSYESVIASWHDTAAAQRKQVQVGQGEPVFTIRDPFADEEAARTAAKCKLDQLNRSAVALSLTLPGDTRLMAGGKVNLSGIRSGVDGLWLISRVTHVLGGSGYHCSVEAKSGEETTE